jgi:hypothetical protein
MAVLDLENQAGLLAEIEDFGSTVLTHEVKEFLIATKVQKCWKDNLLWLPDRQIFDEFHELAYHYYTHHKGYHACCPVSVKSYFEKGFLVQEPNQLVEDFKKIFSDLDSLLIQRVVEDCELHGYNERGKVFFSTNSEYLLNHGGGSFLIYGSEYLQAMARILCEKELHNENFMLRLKNRGYPTVFEVNVPRESIPSERLEWISKVLIAFWGNNIIGIQDPIEDGGFASHSDIAPENIVSHLHPAVIRDPLNENSEYKSENITCDVCREA